MKIIKYLLVIALFIILLNTTVYGIIAKDYDFNQVYEQGNIVTEKTNSTTGTSTLPKKIDAEYTRAKIISKGMAYVLKTLQVLQYLLPIVFFIGMLVRNSLKENKQNNIINIVKYLIISILILFATIGLGEILLNKSESYGYSSKTIDYINYNGKVIYYHR